MLMLKVWMIMLLPWLFQKISVLHHSFYATVREKHGVGTAVWYGSKNGKKYVSYRQNFMFFRIIVRYCKNANGYYKYKSGIC